MDVQAITVNKREGTAKGSGKHYAFLQVGCLMVTPEGPQYVELTLDAEHPTVEPGKRYTVDLSFYSDRDKRLAHRVEALRPVAPK